MAKRTKTIPLDQKKHRPALSEEAREQQLIALAVDLVEQRLIDGTASSQETTHFLKLASRKAKLECDILEEQRNLIKEKTESLKSAKREEELYEKAIQAMRIYNGQPEDNYNE